MKRLVMISAIAALLATLTACSALKGDCSCGKKKAAASCEGKPAGESADGGSCGAS